MADSDNDPKETSWASIEADYRAGSKPLRVIASENGITEGAIRKRAKKEQWPRDLTAKIRAQADAIVRKDAVRREVRETERVPEKEIVEANAELQVRIRREQRGDIQRMRAMVVKFIKELEDDNDQKDVKKKLPLQTRVAIMQKIAETHKTVVNMEREHFGITSRFGEDENPAAVQYDSVETARRIAFLLARAVNQGA
jgi:hypothetical protein